MLEDLIIGKDVKKHANVLFPHTCMQNTSRSHETLPTPKSGKHQINSYEKQ